MGQSYNKVTFYLFWVRQRSHVADKPKLPLSRNLINVKMHISLDTGRNGQ